MQADMLAWPWIGRLRSIRMRADVVRQAWLNTPKARGLAAAQEGRLPVAIRLLEQARREISWIDPDLDAHIAEIRAIRRYRRRLQDRPNDPEALVNVGRALMAQELADEALACFRRATILTPGYTVAHNLIGLELHYRGDLSGARDAFARSLEIDDSQGSVRDFLHALGNEENPPLDNELGLALTAGT